MDAEQTVLRMYVLVLRACYNEMLCVYNACICHGFQIAPHACSCVIEKLSAIQC